MYPAIYPRGCLYIRCLSNHRGFRYECDFINHCWRYITGTRSLIYRTGESASGTSTERRSCRWTTSRSDLVGMFMVGTPDRLLSFRHHAAQSSIYSHSAKFYEIQRRGYQHLAGTTGRYQQNLLFNKINLLAKSI